MIGLVLNTRRIWWGLLISGIFLLVFTEWLPVGHQIDAYISHFFFNETTHQFWLAHEGWTEKILHDWIQDGLRIVALYALIQVLYGYYQKRKNALNAQQIDALKRWVAFFVTSLVVTVLITQLKKWTNIACPWNLSEFSGQWAYAGLFDKRPWARGEMACWPAGYGAAGFTLLSLVFVGGWPMTLWSKTYRRSKWLSAHAFWYYGLIAGMLFGGIRILQGGHFVSHQLWALWWVILANMILLKVGLFKADWLNGSD